MKRNFETWLKSMKKSIADYTYYTNFPKVYNNVSNIKVELNILNSLINSPDIEGEFRELIVNYPGIIKAIPILLAKRESEILITEKDSDKTFNFTKANHSVDEYVNFMHKTGLFDLLSNHIISDLTDYVRGVEVGLDSNARKNRTGQTMENIVEEHLKDAGFIKDQTYFKEMRTNEIKAKFGIELNLSTIGRSRAEKRFDFVVKTKTTVYAIEVNFYAGGGSKLNETARSYKTIALETKDVPNFKFIWITDGVGWNNARNNLKETFDVFDDVYNIKELNNGILKEVLK